jgi:leucyl-tRNA synthetase
VEYPVCVNGKKRDLVEVPANMTQQEIQAIALSLDNVKKYVEGKELIKDHRCTRKDDQSGGEGVRLC